VVAALVAVRLLRQVALRRFWRLLRQVALRRLRFSRRVRVS
jgi:hypothetical protein